MSAKPRSHFATRWLAPGLLLAAFPVWAADATRGKSVYAEYCVSCHGSPPQGGPERAGNNPALISAAINGKVPSMAFLRSFVTGTDVADIAAYIASLSAPPTPPPAPVPAFDYTDLWWGGASESGWGVSIIQHASTTKIFAVMYTYDLDRRPMWLMLPDGAWASPTLYSGTFYRVTGPTPAGVTFDSTKVGVLPIGTATLAFSDRDHATFSYTAFGVQYTRQISRPSF